MTIEAIAAAAAPEASDNEWRAGWPVIVASAVGIYLSIIHIYSLGLFIAPLEAAYGWKREQVTAGSLIVSLFSFFLNPFIGMILDRYSVRWVAIPGVIAYSLCLAALGLTGPSLASWWLAWVMLGISYTLVSTPVWMLLPASRFTKHRGMALAFTLLGTGTAGATVPLLSSRLIDALGWSHAYMALGGLGLVVALPAVVFMLRDDRSHVRRLDDPKHAAARLTGHTLAQGIRSLRFWKLAAASVLAVIGVLGLTVHFVPILAERGIDRTTAAGIAGLVGVGGIAGRLITGYCLDKIHGAIVGGVAFSLPIIACVLLQTASAPPAFMAAAAILGMSLGAEVDVAAYLTTRYFGMKNYGALFGAISGCLTLGAGFGPFVAGAVFDRLGDYVMLERVLMGTFLLSGILVFTLGKYPDLEAPADRPAPASA